MSENKSPSTRELISDAEALRGDAKGRVPKTRQLVREAEELIGREAKRGAGAKLWLPLLLLTLVGAGVAAYLLFGN